MSPDMTTLSKEMREKLATIDFGLQVQAFLKSRIGAFLVNRAQIEVEEHTQRLKVMDIIADPHSATRVQMKIASAENILYWLADAIREGAQLTEQLMSEERQALGSDDSANPGDVTGS